MKRILTLLLFLSAITLSISAEYFSIYGLSQVFAAKSGYVIALACSVALAKLTMTGFLHYYWKSLSSGFWGVFKYVFLVFTVLIIVLTSAGVFGFLSDAYQVTADKNLINESKIQLLQNKKNRWSSQVSELGLEKKVINDNILNLSKSLTTNNQYQYVDKRTNQVITNIQKTSKKGIEEQLSLQNNRMSVITNKIDNFVDSIQHYEIKIIESQQNNKAASELRILRHLSSITGYSISIISSWYIFILVIIADPLAIALLVAALHTTQYEKEILPDIEVESNITPVITPDPIISVPDPVVKKKRGRPRKSNTLENHTEPIPVVKKKRGRPRKVQPQVLNTVVPEFESSNRTIAEIGLTQETARHIIESLPKKRIEPNAN